MMKSNLRESMQDHCTSEPNLIQHSAADLKSPVISWELSTTGLTWGEDFTLLLPRSHCGRCETEIKPCTFFDV